MSLSAMTAPQPGPSLLPRIQGLLTGPGFVALGAYMFIKLGPSPGSASYKAACAIAGFGLLWSALALWLPAGRWWNLLRWCSMNLLMLCAFVAGLEAAGRVARIDFAHLGKKHVPDPREAYPIWSREPDVPLPEVFFLHRGPAVWTGQ